MFSSTSLRFYWSAGRLNLGRMKRLTWHPFLHTLTSKTVIFGTWVCYFYKRIKFVKGIIKVKAKKRHNFLIRKIIKIRRHGFVGECSDNVTCSPNFSQFGPGAANMELKMHVQLTYFLLSRNREKLKFGGIPVSQ